MPEPPDFLKEAPRLLPHLQIYMNAFWDLCGDRAGMGDGRILWSAANAWACRRGFNCAQFDDLWYYLRDLDSVFLEAQKAK